MTQIRFYIDEDAMRNSFVNALRNSGLDVLTVAEVGRLGESDATQLNWATEQNRILYSFNVKDFSSLHHQLLAQGVSHAGIIVVPSQRYSVGEQLRALLNLTNSLTTEQMVNRLVFLSNFLNS